MADQTASEYVEYVRNLFRSNLPESNAWLPTSIFSIMSTAIGGLMWSAVKEARSGVDRIMIDTATGADLDALAARPPFSTFRRGETAANGFLQVAFAGVSQINSGEQFPRGDGVTYTACCDTPLDATGSGLIEVDASVSGITGNAIQGMPLTDTRGAVIVGPDGIGGGFAEECDDELRARLYRTGYPCAFNSIPSMQADVASMQGVSDTFACEVEGAEIYVTIAGRDYGIPNGADIAAIEAQMAEPCNKRIGVCTKIIGAIGQTFTLELNTPCPSGLTVSEIESAITDWLLVNSKMGAGLSSTQIENILSAAFPSVSFGEITTEVAGIKGVVVSGVTVVIS